MIKTTAMKRLILCLTLLAGLTFMACSDDDSENSALNCVTCSLTDNDTGQSDVQQVCEQDGNAYVNNTDTGVAFSDYISLNTSAGYICN